MQVSATLDCIAEAVTRLAQTQACRAVIHTALGGGRSGRLSKAPAPGAPFLLLEQPVEHALLLPQCTLVSELRACTS